MCVFSTKILYVLDKETPVFNDKPVDVNINNDDGQASAVVSWSDPLVTDNSGFYTLTVDNHSGSAFGIGITVVTYHAVDASENAASYSFIVTVAGTFCLVLLFIPLLL